jgi:hypothetical protein
MPYTFRSTEMPLPSWLLVVKSITVYMCIPPILHLSTPDASFVPTARLDHYELEDREQFTLLYFTQKN